MPNEVVYLFKAEDIQKLMALKPDYFLIRTGIEPQEAGGTVVGVVTIFAEAYKNGQQPLASTAGCPVPPCTAP